MTMVTLESVLGMRARMPCCIILCLSPQKLFLWSELSRDSLLRMLTTVLISFHWVLGVPVLCWELGWCSTCCGAEASYSYSIEGNVFEIIPRLVHASLDKNKVSIFSPI